MKVYNTYTKKKEIFESKKEKKVKMFVCGPTVYDRPHLGHAKTYLAYDMITKWFVYRGYQVYYLMNITDIDDKILLKAKLRGEQPLIMAKKYEDIFFEEIKLLNIDSITHYARASDHIFEIQNQIKNLLDKGFAYITDSGVFFDVSKFDDYGKLSHQNPNELKKHRIEPDPSKRNSVDFSLWKKSKKDEVNWPSPWGFGRPGWHIEDTAIAKKYFGPQYDVHGGGIDLIFPHHEAEIAQMESISNKKPMVKFWIHAGSLKVKGEKMAKSKDNFINIKDILKQYDSETLRLYFFSTHYRSVIEFNIASLEQARTSLESMYNTINNLLNIPKKSNKLTSNEQSLLVTLKETIQKFEEAMDDDFNSPLALSYIYILIKELNKFLNYQAYINDELLDKILSSLKKLSATFGILQNLNFEFRLPPELLLLVKKRELAKKNKDWKTADQIRNQLKSLDIILEDTPQGVRWKRNK